MREYRCPVCKKYFIRRGHLHSHLKAEKKCKLVYYSFDKVFNQTPIRFYDKTKSLTILDILFSKFIKFRKYKNIYSHFFDDGLVEFYLQTKYDFNIFARCKNIQLYNFWNTCKYKNKELVDMLQVICKNINENDINFMRYAIDKTPNNIVKQCYYLIINNYSYHSKLFRYSSINKLKNLNLSGVKFINYNENISNDTLSIYIQPNENYDVEKLYDILKDKTNWVYVHCYKSKYNIKRIFKDFYIADTYHIRKKIYLKSRFCVRSFEFVVFSKDIYTNSNINIINNEIENMQLVNNKIAY